MADGRDLGEFSRLFTIVNNGGADVRSVPGMRENGHQAGTVSPPFHAPRIMPPATAGHYSGRPDSVRRAAAWMDAHPGFMIESTAPPWHRARTPGGAVLDEHTDLGRLVDRLEAADEQRLTDEADLETLRRWWGSQYSITYDADRKGSGRWEARPAVNLRESGAIADASAAGLAYRLSLKAPGGISAVRG